MNWESHLCCDFFNPLHIKPQELIKKQTISSYIETKISWKYLQPLQDLRFLRFGDPLTSFGLYQSFILSYVVLKKSVD